MRVLPEISGFHDLWFTSSGYDLKFKNTLNCFHFWAPSLIPKKGLLELFDVLERNSVTFWGCKYTRCFEWLHSVAQFDENRLFERFVFTSSGQVPREVLLEKEFSECHFDKMQLNSNEIAFRIDRATWKSKKKRRESYPVHWNWNRKN